VLLCVAKTMQSGCVTCYMGPAGAVMGQTRFSAGTSRQIFEELRFQRVSVACFTISAGISCCLTKSS